ncbi:hypothetical protein H072_10732 [Dactylellina haptotyla CBS 200.50]|uniref:Zn(2)-C6 fungal-type domain-containing protein n=1 Tax=Dactylellina haptotyla (strain CBS 200.50) TaxID=1284197 RepID=S8BKM3_DACHA|nr:hypothetical protein H072_10732 [Dactylellina haptotyla CBS 200.50]
MASQMSEMALQIEMKVVLLGTTVNINPDCTDTPRQPQKLTSSVIRRPHSKTRTGCTRCKERRIKVFASMIRAVSGLNLHKLVTANEDRNGRPPIQCGEHHPTCENCTRAGRTCLYEKIKGEIPVALIRERRKHKEVSRALAFVNVTGEDVAQKDTQAIRGVFHAATWNPGNIARDENAEKAGNGVAVSRLGGSFTWQGATSTSMQVGMRGADLGSTDLKLVNMYRSFTSKNIPFSHIRDEPWQTPTFEIAYQHPFYYHMVMAISAAHIRRLRGGSSPSLAETYHVAKAVPAYRDVISRPDRTGFPIEANLDCRIVFATAALLIIYMWTITQTDVYTNISILSGSTHLVKAFGTRQTFGPIWQTIDVIPRYWMAIFTVYIPRTYVFEGLEWILPKRDIYSTEHMLSIEWEFPDSNIIDVTSLSRLVAIMTILSSPYRPSRRIFAFMVRTMFAWVTGTHPNFLEKVKEKDEKAYVVAAHYFATLVKMGKAAEGYTSEEPTENEDNFIIGDSSTKTWWMQEGPRSLCKTIVKELRPSWSPWLRWVNEVTEEPDN